MSTVFFGRRGFYRLKYIDVDEYVVVEIGRSPRLSKYNTVCSVLNFIAGYYLLKSGLTKYEYVVYRKSDTSIVALGCLKYIKLSIPPLFTAPAVIVSADDPHTHCKLLENLRKWCSEALLYGSINQKLPCAEPVRIVTYFSRNPFLKIARIFFYATGMGISTGEESTQVS